MQTEERTVQTFLELMSPLVPVGKLAVVITGAAQRSRHRRLRSAVIRQAARFRTHRSLGSSILQVHFGPGMSSCDHGSLLLCIDIDDAAKKTRTYRIILLFIGCVVLLFGFRFSTSRGVVGLKHIA